MWNGDYYRVVGIHIFHREVAGIGYNVGATFVTKFCLNLFEFFNDYALTFFGIGENKIQFFDKLHQFFIFGTKFVLLKIGELTQTHLNDSIGLIVIEAEADAEFLLCFVDVSACLDDVYYFVDVIACHYQTLHDMSTSLSLIELEAGAANYHIVAEVKEVIKYFLQVESLWTSVYKSNVIHAERRLEFGHLKQLVEHHSGIGIATHVDNYAHTITVTFVVNIWDAFNLLFVHQVGYLHNKQLLVHVVRNLGNDNSFVLGFGFYFGFCSYHYSTSTGFKSFFYATEAVDDATCREVGAFDVLH